jgi:hypothetical protein
VCLLELVNVVKEWAGTDFHIVDLVVGFHQVASDDSLGCVGVDVSEVCAHYIASAYCDRQRQ